MDISLCASQPDGGTTQYWYSGGVLSDPDSVIHTFDIEAAFYDITEVSPS